MVVYAQADPFAAGNSFICNLVRGVRPFAAALSFIAFIVASLFIILGRRQGWDTALYVVGGIFLFLIAGALVGVAFGVTPCGGP